MQLGTLKPVVVTASGPWQADKPEYGNFIEVADPDNADDKFRYSLGKDSDVEVPPVGSVVHLGLDFFIRREARMSKAGNPYIADLTKSRVTALKAA